MGWHTSQVSHDLILILALLRKKFRTISQKHENIYYALKRLSSFQLPKFHLKSIIQILIRIHLLLQGRVKQEAVQARTSSWNPPALPGGFWGIPRPAEGHSLSSMSWVVLARNASLGSAYWASHPVSGAPSTDPPVTFLSLLHHLEGPGLLHTTKDLSTEPERANHPFWVENLDLRLGGADSPPSATSNLPWTSWGSWLDGANRTSSPGSSVR